jgi:hypothetical protein
VFGSGVEEDTVTFCTEVNEHNSRKQSTGFPDGNASWHFGITFVAIPRIVG